MGRRQQKRVKLMQYAVIITMYGSGQYSTEKDGQEATKKNITKTMNPMQHAMYGTLYSRRQYSTKNDGLEATKKNEVDAICNVRHNVPQRKT